MNHLEQFYNDLIAKFTTIILSALREELPPLIRSATQKEFLTVKEFYDLTGLNQRKQQYLRDERRIPFMQEGRIITYRRVDAEKFVEENLINKR